MFPGFRPAIEACLLDWNDYQLPGITYSPSRYYSPVFSNCDSSSTNAGIARQHGVSSSSGGVIDTGYSCAMNFPSSVQVSASGGVGDTSANHYLHSNKTGSRPQLLDNKAVHMTGSRITRGSGGRGGGACSSNTITTHAAVVTAVATNSNTSRSSSSRYTRASSNNTTTAPPDAGALSSNSYWTDGGSTSKYRDEETDHGSVSHGGAIPTSSLQQSASSSSMSSEGFCDNLDAARDDTDSPQPPDSGQVSRQNSRDHENSIDRMLTGTSVDRAGGHVISGGGINSNSLHISSSRAGGVEMRTTINNTNTSLNNNNNSSNSRATFGGRTVGVSYHGAADVSVAQWVTSSSQQHKQVTGGGRVGRLHHHHHLHHNLHNDCDDAAISAQASHLNTSQYKSNNSHYHHHLHNNNGSSSSAFPLQQPNQLDHSAIASGRIHNNISNGEHNPHALVTPNDNNEDAVVQLMLQQLSDSIAASAAAQQQQATVQQQLADSIAASAAAQQQQAAAALAAAAADGRQSAAGAEQHHPVAVVSSSSAAGSAGTSVDIFSNLKKLEDPAEILFARAEGLHAHGHVQEASKLAVRLAEELLARPPNLILDLPLTSTSKNRRKKVCLCSFSR